MRIISWIGPARNNCQRNVNLLYGDATRCFLLVHRHPDELHVTIEREKIGVVPLSRVGNRAAATSIGIDEVGVVMETQERRLHKQAEQLLMSPMLHFEL